MAVKTVKVLNYRVEYLPSVTLTEKVPWFSCNYIYSYRVC